MIGLPLESIQRTTGRGWATVPRRAQRRRDAQLQSVNIRRAVDKAAVEDGEPFVTAQRCHPRVGDVAPLPERAREAGHFSQPLPKKPKFFVGSAIVAENFTSRNIFDARSSLHLSPFNVAESLVTTAPFQSVGRGVHWDSDSAAFVAASNISDRAVQDANSAFLIVVFRASSGWITSLPPASRGGFVRLWILRLHESSR